MMFKNRWKKAACLILTIISTVCLGKVDVKAADYWPDAPETLSPSVILMEESTGTILYEKNMDEAHYPASITKIMTTLLALENGNLSDMVTFSDDAINNTEGSGIARDYGEQMTLEQCLYGVMLESANECAYAVAEHVGGTVENFVDMMNAKAKELGCTNTHFANPHGLQDENNPSDQQTLGGDGVEESPRYALHLPQCEPQIFISVLCRRKDRIHGDCKQHTCDLRGKRWHDTDLCGNGHAVTESVY